MACVTVIVFLAFLVHIVGVLTPGWMRTVQDDSSTGEYNSTNAGLFYVMRCTNEGCITKTIYEDSPSLAYQGDALYPRKVANEFHASLAVLLNLLGLFSTQCAARKNKGTAKMALISIVLQAYSFFVTFGFIVDYIVIYILAKRHESGYTFATCRTQTPYSLIITGVALFMQASVITYFLAKLRRLLDEMLLNNEAPPPYHLLRNDGGGHQHNYGTSNETQHPAPNAPTDYPRNNNPFEDNSNQRFSNESNA
ncbi:uncharacterized protein LOC133196671 [Saccostrea echinata]|uniref:uncharacterized protein LOC133196671 n=1 Tax=Saccostrea echinata TaxID=191078 RepID=UPI002A7F5042|nr:uncharacterized protein LOC133196671 [Saccostrea echinata]